MHRKWTIILLGFVLTFIAINGVIWKAFTEDILEFRKFYNGGLDRMGYIIGSKHYRKPESTLPKKHIENADYTGQRIDMVTIGDSFSNTRDNGRDPLYQDWIASIHNLEVLNIQRLNNTNVFETIVILCNSGYLDKIKPRFLILETVERNCAREYARDYDFSLTRPLAEIEELYKTTRFQFKWPDIGFINTGNFKFVYYAILRKYLDRGFYSGVYTRELDASFFSVKNDKLLLFYGDDLGHMPASNEKNIRKMNDNFNRLTSLLAKKGIKLYFMPAADKYNIYSDHIVNNPYPKSVFFELLRKMPKRYFLIDTKALFLEEIAKGERDIYYADDTHWSWKSSKKIAESLKF